MIHKVPKEMIADLRAGKGNSIRVERDDSLTLYWEEYPELSYLDFYGADFSGMDFSNAQLCWSILSRCNLTNVSFRDASLYRTAMNYANITGADFDGVYARSISCIGTVGRPKVLGEFVCKGTCCP